MAITVGGISIDLQANSAIIVKEMERAARATLTASKRMQTETRGMSASFARLERNVGRGMAGVTRAAGLLGAALGGLSTVLVARRALEYASAYTNVQNSLRAAGVEAADLARVSEDLFDVANRTRAPIAAISQLYQRLSLVSGELGVSQREILDLTETVGQALAVSGTSAEQASGALLQLSQALGGGTVRAEEFNSILEGAPVIARAAAQGIAATGGSVAKLRQMVIAGEISSREFFEALQAGAAGIEEAFSATQITVSQALTNLSNAFIETIGGIDESAGATNRLAQSINDLAGVIRDLPIRDFTEGVAASVAVLQSASDVTGAWFEQFAGGLPSLQSTRDEIERIVDLLAGLAGATKAPDTSLEALAPPDVVRRIQEMRKAAGPLAVDIRDDAIPGANARPGTPATPRIIRPAPMSRAQAQSFNLDVVSTHRGGPQAFTDSLDALRQMSQEQAKLNEEIVQTPPAVEEVSLAYDLALDTSRQFAQSVASGFTDAIFAGKSLSDTLNDIGLSLAKAITEAIIFKSIMMAIGQGGTADSPGSGIMGALFPAPRQHGGPVRSGMPYLVGERGPEIIVPSRAGNVIPNAQLRGGGGGGGVTIIDQRGRGAPSIEQSVDARGMLSILVKSELAANARDGTLSRLTGTRRAGIARG